MSPARTPHRFDVARLARATFWNLILAAAYFGVAHLSLAAATQHRVVASIWPPAGIAFFVLVRYGITLWPGVALGAYLLNATSGIPVAGSLLIATGDTLEALAGALMVRRAVQLRWSLDRVRDVVALTVLAGVCSTVIASTIGIATLTLSGSTSASTAFSLWIVWWTGEAVGVLVVAPLLFVWTTRDPMRSTWRWRTAEAALTYAAVALVTDVLFSSAGMFVFAVYPLGMWLAWRFGPRGAATSVAVVTLIAGLRTLAGYGPFTTLGPTANLFALQLFLVLFAVTSLLFAAARAEALESDARIQQSETRYRMLARHLPDGCVVLFDAALHLLLVEGPAIAAAGFVKEEIEGHALSEIFEPAQAQRLEVALRAAIRGAAMDLEFTFRDRTYLVRALPLPESSLALGMALVLDVTQREAARREMVKSREQLERLSRLLLTAQEDERKRVAREVHDELGQALTAVKIGLAHTMQRVQRRNSLESERRVHGAADTLDRAIESVQRIVLRLRPGVLDNLGPLAALEYEVQRFHEQTDIEVSLSLPPEPLAIDDTRSTTLYRTVQEALTNVMRHAQARRVEVSLVALDHQLVLQVVDDGLGIGEDQLRNPRSMGILGMRERAAACGARLEVLRVPTGGTRVVLTIPRADRNGVTS